MQRLRRTSKGEAGISLLEVLIALAIVALATIVATTSIRLPVIDQPKDRVRLAQFLDDLTFEVSKSGQIALLRIQPGRLSVGSRLQTWNAASLHFEGPPQPPDDIRVILYPDGTTSGPSLAILDGDGSWPVPFVNRYDP